MDLRDSLGWDRQLEGGLPDCRLSGSNRNRKTVFLRGNLPFERVFCANCGEEGGAVSADWVPHVFYICWDCVRHAGPPPGLTEVSEAVVKGGPAAGV